MASPGPLLSHQVTTADLGRLEEALRAAVTTEDPFLTEVASHLIQAGGKRGRPLFAVGAASTTRPVIEPAIAEVLSGGVSVELVHLGSLYHDDVMDEATTRRSVESVNAKWGNLQAILAGDFLLARASEIAASLGTEVAALLARTIARLCEGQVLELRDTYNAARTEERYLASIEGKTASLFATACRIGALTGGHERHAVDALTDFGRSYGMAFQIVDDILDVTATDEQLGKPAGHDLIEGVYTLPVIRAVEAGGEASQVLGELLGQPMDVEQMQRARQAVRSSGQVADACDVALEWVERACASLDALDPSEGRDALAGQARHLTVAIEAHRS